MRKFISLTALFAFIVTIVTSLILYIAPQGRIAYWADWTLWGLTKEQWSDLHVNLGTLFLLALALHAYYNWKAITAYLSRARKLVVFTPEAVAALVVLLVAGVGTYSKVPPFSSFLALADHFKAQAAKTYGEPPYGHAELSRLGDLAPKIGLTPEQVLETLRKAGYPEATGQMTLLELSRRRGVSPQIIYKALQPRSEGRGLPETPPPGTGSAVLADFCAAHELVVADMVAALERAGFTARADMTLKAIAEAGGKDPRLVYDVLRKAASHP